MTEQPNQSILVINCGSSSLKFSCYQRASLSLHWSGSVTHIGSEESRFEIRSNEHKELESRLAYFKDLDAAVKELITWMESRQDRVSLSAIGHRLVQGGPEHRQPEVINTQLLKVLEQYIYLAPNHLPDELKAIRAFQSVFPEVTQVACFDTAFHKDMPSYAKNYPLPGKYKDMGLMKYGFHGLSYQYVLRELEAENQEVIKKKIIIAHLGNGASMAAVQSGTGVDTTMGISPIGGLVMGTRSGDLDPGVILFLIKQGKLTTDQLDDLLSRESGLKAIAGISDIQELLKAETDDPTAAEALKVFCYTAKKFIAALAAAMGGLDLLVFTGGIGENAAVIRERICGSMEFMGLELSKKKNTAQEPVISKKKSRVAIRVIPTNEELMIARLTGDLLNHKK